MESKIPEDLRYTKEHEWAKVEGDRVVVGITHHAQSQLGDVVYLELPEVSAQVVKDKTFGVVESVKAVSDLFAPISGEVVETNKALIASPEQINQDPYGAWMIKIKPASITETNDLMLAKDYTEYLKSTFK